MSFFGYDGICNEHSVILFSAIYLTGSFLTYRRVLDVGNYSSRLPLPAASTVYVNQFAQIIFKNLIHFENGYGVYFSLLLRY